MQVIYKQTLEITDEQKITLPNDAALLDCQVQDDKITFWYVFCIDNPETVETTFYVVGTGNEYPETFSGTYWKTLQLDGFVWHVFFKRLNKREPVVVEVPDAKPKREAAA